MTPDTPSDDPLITPDSFVTIARSLYNNETVHDGVCDSGFVISGYRSTFVGLAESDGAYIIARMSTGSETIGRSNPKLKTRQNEYAKAELRRVELPDDVDQTDSDAIEAAFEDEDAERIDTGYINGYRVTPLSDVIDDIFKWYSTDS
jgi:hypothetical protein